ncbi:DUF4269 domain-containing protein [Fulvivirgaceae bacterium PWU4]|uniref:DUF4269 domain-containing protein n=1 Tax=Chryseosolibacter histidini TaxID=2782349 RepID=A0AAP2DLB8_9BACT|nr:DUF4269 domain-containing protein [Chryseosolibacter histidini]MBT1698478.1 DUF4269 domain-containing protein [Chryseosolibacter histidini]
MLPDFENISYLRSGSPIQRKAYDLLIHSKILYHLRPFRPILTGTLPLDLFIDGKSDLDIICQSSDFESVEKFLLRTFAAYSGFSILQKNTRSVPTLICRFHLEGFLFELFFQATDPREQMAYRHMLIEYKLLEKGGDTFRRRVMELKMQGTKTEPAFAVLLGLQGDPYESLLSLEE